MSEAPENTAIAAEPQPGAARNSPLDEHRAKRFDPAALMIGIGGVVLLVALWWLLVTPRSARTDDVDPARVAQIEQRLSTLDGLRGEVGAIGARVQQVEPLDGRIRALEARPAPPDINPLESQVTALTERLAAAERGTAQAAAQGNERGATLDRRLQALEARPAFDPATAAPRDAFDALVGRTERLTERAEAQAARLQEQAKADEQRDAAAQQAVGEKLTAMDSALGRRLDEQAKSDEQRDTAAQQAATQRVAALEATLGQRLSTLEAAQQRLVAIESRTSRLASVDALRGALTAGQPLGEALGRIDQPPPALARFATAAPPTEASLRLSFEDAAKAARAASDAAMQPDGSRTGVVDSALSRLGGLVTIRRGEQVVWGDAAEAEIERARRALEAGDIEMSLQHIDKLPPPARGAMQPWAEQARSLIAARGALRQLAAG